MAFKDRYGITRFETVNKGRISFSIDNNRDIVEASLLLIPNVDEHEHSHVVFTREQLKKLKSALALKGTNFVNLDHRNENFMERLNFYEGKVDGSLISIELVEINKKENDTTGVCLLHLTGEAVNGLRDWIDDFFLLSDEDLEIKFNKDWKNIKP